MKTILTLFFAFISLNIFSQDNTTEALSSRVVKSYIYIVADPGNKYFKYMVDPSDFSKFDVSNMKDLKKAYFSSKMKDQQINFRIRFLNPLKFYFLFSEQKKDDPSYQSIGKFLELITSLSTQLNIPTTISTTSTDPTNKIVLGDAETKSFDEEDLTNEAILKKINSPLLTHWKFEYVTSGKDCITNPDEFLKNLKLTDNLFYDGGNEESNSFLSLIKSSINSLSSRDSVSSFQKAVKDLDDLKIKEIEKRISDGKSYLSNLEVFAKSLQIKDNSSCPEFKAYTVQNINDFIAVCKTVNKTRESINTNFKNLSNELKKLLINSSESNNTLELGKYDIDDAKISEISLEFGTQEITLNESGIIDSKKTKIFVGEAKCRSHQSLVAEISSGVFYTNIKHTTYGTEMIGNDLKVSEGKENSVPVVAATHLNLIPNWFDGIAHPMIQLGVGTGVKFPSFLAGAGFRFLKPRHLGVAGGLIWSWSQRLTEGLNVGSIISGTAELDKKTKYSINRPNMYLGLQFNF